MYDSYSLKTDNPSNYWKVSKRFSVSCVFMSSGNWHCDCFNRIWVSSSRFPPRLLDLCQTGSSCPPDFNLAYRGISPVSASQSSREGNPWHPHCKYHRKWFSLPNPYLSTLENQISFHRWLGQVSSKELYPAQTYHVSSALSCQG